MPRKLTRLEEVAQPVQMLSGRTGEILETDSVATEVLTTIPYVHHKVHEQDTYQSSYKTPEQGEIADNGNLDLLLIVGTEYVPHLVFEGACGGDAELLLYENVTVSANGTVMDEFNMDRNAIKGAELQVFHTPTVTNVGNLMQNVLLPDGTNPRALGGVARQGTEWMLGLGRQYLLRLTNRAGSAQPASLLVQWYEKAP